MSMKYLFMYSDLLHKVELCSVMLTLSTELKSVMLRHAVQFWGAGDC